MRIIGMLFLISVFLWAFGNFVMRPIMDICLYFLEKCDK